MGRNDRLMAEMIRVANIKRNATPPARCGDAIPAAPARGAMYSFQPREVVITDRGNFAVRPTGEIGREGERLDAAAVADTFQRMQSAADRRAKDGKADPLFDRAHVAAARNYTALAERVAAAGVKCSQAERIGGGGGGASWIDAVIRDSRRLDKMRAAIGDGWAIEPRRVSPQADRRRAIKLRTAVDMVCIGDRTVADVLARFGWSRDKANVTALRAALSGAFERMRDI